MVFVQAVSSLQADVFALFRFSLEALLLLRKWAVIVAGIAFQDAFWAVVACLSSYIPMWRLLIRWKPYATQGSQFDARLVQAVILLLLVWLSSFAFQYDGCEGLFHPLCAFPAAADAGSFQRELPTPLDAWAGGCLVHHVLRHPRPPHLGLRCTCHTLLLSDCEACGCRSRLVVTPVLCLMLHVQ